jgi:pilus assembly protein CpaB
MTARNRRRRGLALLALAVACGGLAASAVDDRIREAERDVGRPVPVVVAARDIAPGTTLRRADLAVSHVPSAHAPRDAPALPAQAVGLRTVGPVAAGSPLLAGIVGGGRDPGGLRRGERALEIAVSGGAPLENAPPGTRVDVIVSTDPSTGPGRTFVALEGAELLALRPGAGGDPAETGAAGSVTAVATLRVTARQAVYLTAAQSFARQLWLLPRPAGDRGRVGRATVTASGL